MRRHIAFAASHACRLDPSHFIHVLARRRVQVLEVQPGPGADEAFVTFQYTSVNKFNPEKNIDGSIRRGLPAQGVGPAAGDERGC